MARMAEGNMTSSPLVAGAPEVQLDELLLAFQMQQQAAFGGIPVNPRCCPDMAVYTSPITEFLRPKDQTGTMQCFVWHKDQKAVCHCLAAILNVADDSNTDASS